MLQKKNKCLVLGGAGFLGYHLRKHLESQEHEVISVDNFFHPCKAPRDGVAYADIRYYNELETYIEWADIVFHLAAQIHVDRSIDFPQETIDINVTGTMNVLEACRKYDKKMIFASTSEVYGTSQTGTISELHPLDGQSPYAASKIAGDRLCKAYRDTFGTKVIILRNFNIFGEWQNDTSYGSVISKFTRAALLDDPLYIFGDGKQERDYMYVDDAIAAYDLCAKLETYGDPINVGTGSTIKIKELAEIIIKLTKSNSQIIHTKSRPGEVQRLCANIEKAKSLGFMSKTDFEKDLAQYVIWYKNNIPLL
tara:strand:+ start:3696 stop:4622 length:927 start_codon:yes stop_codon:yes gene_type:complete